MGVSQIVAEFLLEIVGYLIWGLLECILTAAGGFFGGMIIGFIISIILFCCLSSAWIAFCASCGVMVVSTFLGVLIEAAGGAK